MHFSPLPYLDPGSGSFLLQLLFAALAGAGIVVYTSWNKIKGWLGIKSKPKQDEDEDGDDDDTTK